MRRRRRTRSAAIALALAVAALGFTAAATPVRGAPEASPAVNANAGAARAAGESARAALVEVAPRGDVKNVRQITARFSTPMAPLGDPRAAIAPVAVSCTPPAEGSGRWIDSRTWVFDFSRELPGGVRCAVELREGLVDLGGQAVAGERRVELATGGPAIVSSRPSEGSTVAEDQAFVLSLDAAATPESITAHAYFAADGVAERIPVAIASPETAAAILATDPRDRPTGPYVVLQARRRFPADTPLRLVWGAGIATATGVATAADQVLPFSTDPPFRAELRCERENANAGCVPLTPIALRFTAPIAAESAARIALVAPDGTRFAQKPPDSPDPEVTRVVFPGPFPPSSALRLEIPADLGDDAGRPLANAAELAALAVAVDALPPLAKFAARFGILEAKAEPALPVTIRGLEPAVRTRVRALAGGAPAATATLRRIDGSSAEILRWLQQVAVARRDRSLLAGERPGPDLSTFDLPEPEGAAMQVVGIPLARPGVYVVELESRKLGAALLGTDAPMFVQAAALVTDLAVHLEWGREGSLVWVTSLEKAEPVAGAAIAVHDCAGKVLWQGRSGADGIARIAALPRESDVPICREPSRDDDWDPHRDYIGSRALSSLTSGLFVTARRGDDLGFVHSSWNEGIETFRWNLPSEPWQGPFAAHTVLARALLRAGDVAYMKHFFRAETLAGFALARGADRPSRVVIRHVGSGAEYPSALDWQADGSAETAWTVPREAKLGRYEVVLVRPGRDGPPADGDAAAPTPTPSPSPRPTPTPPPPYEIVDRGGDDFQREWVAAELRVEEFRVPLLRASIALPGGPLVAPEAVPVDVAVRYLAGGAAGGLPVVLRSRIVPAEVAPPPALAGFSVANGAIATGITRQEQGTDLAATGDDADGGAGGAAAPDRAGLFSREEARLDAAGSARSTIRALPAPARAEKLLVEVEFRDPNGEAQTASATAELWPAALLPAVRADFRRDGKRRIRVEAAAIGVDRAPVAGVAMVVEVLRRVTYTTRQRVVGGFYAYQDVEEVRRVGTLCRGRTGADGVLRCARRAAATGDLIVQARLADDRGRGAAAHAEIWVPGPEDAWFEMSDSDRIDLVPERRRYEPGETARLQVRMPFRRARALVTTGREGVIDARVVELTGKDPTVEVPIAGAFSPNVFVQVLAVRGRVSAPPPTALVDLGKPAFRMGIAELEVGWKPHALVVRVEPEREVYAVRDTARVAIAAAPLSGAPLPAGASVAIAAVDEGLLELLPNPTVDLLRAMMGRRGYLVDTATAQMQVVGKRHFGKKVLPPGGGGGRQTTRELFDTLLLWRGRVALDASGRATIDVPLNDSLTSFRIVAVASAGPDLFGTGEATIRATKDLMVLSGLPPVVRSGDRFRAEFTVRNTTDRVLDVEVAGRAEGLAAPDLASEKLALAPGEARVVGWPVEAPADRAEVAFEVGAKATDGASDRLRVAQQVAPAVPVRTLQATLAQWTGPGSIAEPIALPAGALPGRGGIDVTLAPSLVAGLGGVRDFMARYPYGCLEQRVSRAIALDDPALWAEVAASLASAQDASGLLAFFPSLADGDVALTAYVLAVSRAAGRTLPDAVEKRMRDGLRAFVDGTLPARGSRTAPGLPLQKLAAASALAAAGAGEPALVASLTIEPALWPTASVLDWWSFLLHVPAMPARAARLAEAESVLRARLDLSGTTLALAGDSRDGGAPFGGGDVDAARLVALAVQGQAFRSDQARLARGALGRQERGRWATTVANAWGSIALRRFAAAHEASAVTGQTAVEMASERASLDWGRDPRGGALALAWPAAPATVTVAHQGGGRPWATIAARAAIPLAAPLAAGYRVQRTVTAIEQRVPGRWSVGDTLRVRLEIEADSERSWVVVDDPVPPGASHLARGFANDAAQPPAGAPPVEPGGPEPAFVERSFLFHRAYYAHVPAGRLALEYAVKLNQSGTFHLPPTHVEALYAPEVFGELPNAPVEIAP